MKESILLYGWYKKGADNIIKAIYDKPIARWKIESISPKIRNKTRVPTLTTSTQHSFGSVGHCNQGRKRSKRNPDNKRRSETLTVCRCLGFFKGWPGLHLRLLESLNPSGTFIFYYFPSQFYSAWGKNKKMSQNFTTEALVRGECFVLCQNLGEKGGSEFRFHPPPLSFLERALLWKSLKTTDSS